MKDSPVLMLSFWNPTPHVPSKGVFIHDQLTALFNVRNNILFIGINILPSKHHLFKVKIEEKKYSTNTFVIINISSFLWKLIYLSPYLVFLFLRRFIKNMAPGFSPAIVHSNIIFPCGFVGERFSRKFNVPHIVSEHWTQVQKILKHPVFGRKAKHVYQRSDKIVCVSKFLMNQIEELTNNQHVVLVPNIVDTNLFRLIPGTRSVVDLSFCCIASWRIPKRLDLIIESLIQFASENSGNIVLNVVGAGIQVDHYKQIELPANFSINWLGYLSKSDVANVLSRSRFFMHASELETFSIVTAEALATGTPVMVSNIGALPELVDADNGILVENNLEAWVAALRKITAVGYDNHIIAQKIIDKYSPASVAGKIVSIYRELAPS